MSLEQVVAALTDEMQKNNALIKQLIELRTDAIETVKDAAASQKKTQTKAEKPKEEPKAEKPKEEPKTEPPKEEPKADKPSAAAPSIPDADDKSDDAVKGHVAAYVTFGGTEESPVSDEERAARMKKVKDVLADPRVNAATVAEIPDNVRMAFRKKINSFIDEIKENGNLTGGATAGSELDDL